MKEWHTSLIMLLAGGISFFLLLPMIHYMTIPPMQWKDVIKLDGSICIFVTPFFALLGWITESNYRRRRGRDMLEKLKQDVN